MHRLQISLPKSQVDFLAERARREGVSIAELLRRLVQSATTARSPGAADSLWNIAGIADDRAPLIDGLAVSSRLIHSQRRCLRRNDDASKGESGGPGCRARRA